MKSITEMQITYNAIAKKYNDNLSKYNAVAVYHLNVTVTHIDQEHISLIGRISSRDMSSIGSFKIHHEIDIEKSERETFFDMIYTDGTFLANPANANKTNIDKVIRSIKKAADEMNTKRTIKALRDSWSS